ncbi:uncharacterized protein LOC143019835 [Oratosquilla oratoria]|uniref:uncharacterized protein LOC143019835 n=1 Tax=Oratosquilla oratoria TaxID=337810 RepID=UPI003F75A7CD
MTGRVLNHGGISEPFAITGGLKQGCVLAQTLFSLYTAAMIIEIPQDAPAVGVRYHLDGGLFKLSRLLSTTKTSIISARELQYADDNTTLNRSPEHLQQTTDLYVDAYQRFGTQVNTEKTKLLSQLPPNQATQVANAQIGDHPVESVANFTYLGSILSRTVTCEKDIENRIKAGHCLWTSRPSRLHQPRHTKTMVFRAVVLSTLLYACETWTLYKRDIKRLESFQRSKLRQILHTHWKDCITNNEVLSRAALPSVEATILQHLLRWVGHVARMEPSRLSKNHSLRRTGPRQRTTWSP